MKIASLIAIVLVSAFSVFAQPKVITLNDYESAKRRAQMLNGSSYSSKRVTQEGRKGTEAKPESESYALVKQESVPELDGPTRIMIEFRENGKTYKTTTVTKRTNGAAGTTPAYLGYDQATNRWYDVIKPYSPIQGSYYTAVPDENPSKENSWPSTDVFSYLGSITHRGRKVEAYQHTKKREFLLDGQKGSYEIVSAFYFTPDGALFRTELKSTRKLTNATTYASNSEETENVPGLTIDIPVSAGRAPNTFLARVSSSGEVTRAWSEGVGNVNRSGKTRRILDFVFTRNNEKVPYLKRTVTTETTTLNDGPYRIVTEHTEGQKPERSEYWLARVDNKWIYTLRGPGGQIITQNTAPKLNDWKYRMLRNGLPKDATVKVDYRFVGFEERKGVMFQAYYGDAVWTYTVNGIPQSLTLSIKTLISDGHAIQEYTEKGIDDSGAKVILKFTEQNMKDPSIVINIPK